MQSHPQSLKQILRVSFEEMPSKSAIRRAKYWNPVKTQEGASQPRALSGRFVSNAGQTPTNAGQTPTISPDASATTNQPVSNAVDLALVENLVDDPDTTHEDKLGRAMALYARCRYEDTEEQALEGKL